MDEDVFAAVIGQETIALGVVEPLDGAGNTLLAHWESSFWIRTAENLLSYKTSFFPTNEQKKRRWDS